MDRNSEPLSYATAKACLLMAAASCSDRELLATAASIEHIAEWIGKMGTKPKDVDTRDADAGMLDKNALARLTAAYSDGFALSIPLKATTTECEAYARRLGNLAKQNADRIESARSENEQLCERIKGLNSRLQLIADAMK